MPKDDEARTVSRWSTRFLETASLPFALALVTTMPAASWFSRKLSRSLLAARFPLPGSRGATRRPGSSSGI